jgi:hypothetical protein
MKKMKQRNRIILIKFKKCGKIEARGGILTYANTAYMKNASDSKLPLYINCCGNEREISENSSVCRPTGRSDYLLLYVPVGGIRLCVREREIICPEKTVILYRPYEPQSYSFFGNDQPENFWVHFAGREAGAILKRFSLDSQTVFSLTATQGLEDLFLQMIAECQSAKPYSQEAAALILQNIAMHRTSVGQNPKQNLLYTHKCDLRNR